MTDAKITVEASLIIPLVISIICSLIYEALLSCDRGALNMSVDRIIEEAASSAGQHGVDDEENITDLTISIRDELSKRLMLYSIEDVSYEEKNNKIVLCIRAAPKAAFGIAGIFKDAFGDYCINRSVKTGNVCSVIRRMDIVKDNT